MAGNSGQPCPLEGGVRIGMDREVGREVGFGEPAEVLVERLRIVGIPALARSSIEWSSSWFSLRSTAQTCQPFAFETTVFASGAKYAALADVPGLRTRTLFALPGPISSTPTLSSLAGVPGASKP